MHLFDTLRSFGHYVTIFLSLELKLRQQLV
jgi:hypothetical protein